MAMTERPTNVVGLTGTSELERRDEERKANELSLQEAHRLYHHAGVQSGDKRIVYPPEGGKITVSGYAQQGVAQVRAWLVSRANAGKAARRAAEAGNLTPALV